MFHVSLPVSDLHPHLIHRSFVPPESISQMAPWSVQSFLYGSWLWPTHRQTNHATAVATVHVIWLDSGCVHCPWSATKQGTISLPSEMSTKWMNLVHDLIQLGIGGIVIFICCSVLAIKCWHSHTCQPFRFWRNFSAFMVKFGRSDRNWDYSAFSGIYFRRMSNPLQVCRTVLTNHNERIIIC